jgi:ketosteroid isomerase-like protein
VAIQDEINLYNEQFAQALNSGDFDRLGQLFTDDVILMSGGTPTVKGRANLIERCRAFVPSDEAVTFQSVEVHENGDVIIDIGLRLRNGIPYGEYVVVHRRQADGSLQLAVDVPF